MKIKRILALLFASVMLLALCACGGNKEESKGDTIESVAETYGLDLKSTEEQEMSTEYTTKEKLNKLVHDFLKGQMYFSGTDMENITYADLKEQLGVDASIYQYEGGGYEKQNFIWQAGDDKTAKFIATFSEGKLYGSGSTNVK